MVEPCSIDGLVTEWNLVRSLWNLESRLESRIRVSQNPRIFGIPKISESQIESFVMSRILHYFLLRYPTRDLYKQLGL